MVLMVPPLQQVDRLVEETGVETGMMLNRASETLKFKLLA